MTPGAKNLLGLLGLILILFYGPALVRGARAFSPFTQMPDAWTMGERQGLIVLGTLVALVVLIAKASRGGRG